MEDKRVYSFNLAAYILFTTGIAPVVKIDEKCDTLYYFVFPQCKEVSAAILAYKESGCVVVLHDFLNSYMVIKNMIAEVKNNGS